MRELGVIKSRILTKEEFIVAIIIFSSYIPYLNGINGTVYAYISIIPFILIVFININTIKVKENQFLVCMVLLLNIVSLIPSITMVDYSLVINFARYILIGVVTIKIISPCFIKNFNFLCKLTINIGLILGLLSIISIFIGEFKFGILRVNRYYDYYILGFKLPTSSSLIWNTNYFGISQVILIPFIGYALKNISRKYIINFIIVNISIIFSGCRSAILLLGLYYGAKLVKMMFCNRKMLIISLMFIIPIIIGLVFYTNFISIANEKFVDTMVQNKGLNGRDDIIGAAKQMIEARPFGYGLSEKVISDNLKMYSEVNGTPQNSYIQYLLRGGWGALAIFIAILGNSIRKFFSGEECEKRKTFFWVLIFIMIDSFARSYSLGGSGFITMYLTASVSILSMKGLGGNSSEKNN